MNVPLAEMPPELLAPAGNWDCVRAAAAAGADAVYFGLSRFNARMRADNFVEEDLPELMEFLHGYGMRGLVTMNTLIFPDELDAARRQLCLLAEAGVDAIIIQDLGLAIMAREVAPQMALHASTQMTITSPEGLAFVESLVPLERAVLARELSVKEIARFSSHVSGKIGTSASTPLEVFVHGALCVAYSGQCLTSESLGQRSANRGECAQACRMPYELVVDGETRELGEVRYLLSPQDLAALDLIPDLVRAGVKSFKIEGRLKSPEYVAAVTRVYRKALDAALGVPTEEISRRDRYSLEMTFSRGLSQGWLGGTNHPELTHGRFGKKRGPLLGTIESCGPWWIRLNCKPDPEVVAGDGVVFDAGENRDHEQGARIWRVEGDRWMFHRVYSGMNFDRIQPGMKVYKTSDPRLETELRRFWQHGKITGRKISLHLKVTGSPGLPLVIATEIAGQSVIVESSECLETATRHPLDGATLTAQLGRLGETRYTLASLENALAGDCHFPLSALNRLRRDLVARLDLVSQTRSVPAPSVLNQQSEIRNPKSEIPTIPPTETRSVPALSVLCRSLEQMRVAMERGVPRIYLDFEDPRRFREAVANFRGEVTAQESKIFLATPRILKPGETGYLGLIEKSAPDGLLLRNLAALHHYQHRDDFQKVGDFSLNVANPITARLLREQASLEKLTVSYDLNIGQVLDLLAAAPPEWFELTLHQHMPMFHMEHCIFCAFMSTGTTYKDCGRPCEKHTVHLRDRVGQLHRLQADVGCRNTLFNGRAQTGARFFPALLVAGLRNFRLELLDEDAEAAGRTIEAYQQLLGGTLDAACLLERVSALEKLGVTEGTLGPR